MLDTLKTPPVGTVARIEVGVLLRRLQRGESLGMFTWRIVYRIDPDAILVVHWFEKKTQRMPKSLIDLCKRRLRGYDRG